VESQNLARVEITPLAALGLLLLMGLVGTVSWGVIPTPPDSIKVEFKLNLL